MKRFIPALALVAFVALPLVSRADDDDDYRWRRRNDPYNQNGPYYGNGPYNNGPYNNGPYGRGGYGYAAPVDRAIRDLQSMNGGRRGWFGGFGRGWGNGEYKHSQDALNNLYEFQSRMQGGRWDNGKLDKGIEHMQKLANSNRLSGRDRNMLMNDLGELRAFRSSRGGGYYGNNGGYGPYRNNRWPW